MHIRSPHAKVSITPQIISHNFNCIHKNILQPCSCESIELVDEYVYLGVTVDCNFKWDVQINKICKRLRTIVGRLYKLKCFVPVSTLKIIYLSLAESTLRYGITTWGHSCKTNLNNVQLVQNALVKLLVKKNIFSQRRNISLLYQNLTLLPVQALLWYRILTQHISDSEYKRKVEHEHNTRFTKNDGMLVPKYNNKYGQRTLEYNVPKLFNMLPSNIKTCELPTGARYMLKQWLLNRNTLY